MKTSDLIEQRAAIVARMEAAHAADNDGEFTAAETELRAIDAKLERAKKIEAIERSEPGRPINGDAKLDVELRSKFSLARMVASTFDSAVDAGFEREVQPELARRAGKPAEGLYVPTEIFERRALTSTGGAELIATEQRPELYISALTAASVLRSLGATVLTGLVGNITIPRETGAPVIGWVAENSALNASDADFDQVTMTPKHAGALSEWSRNMVLQSSPQVEQLLRNMLARDLALAIDRAGILGGGTNQPTGILAASGVQSQAYATSIYNTTADMIDKADTANVMARRSFLAATPIRKIGHKALDGQGLPMKLADMFHGEPVNFSNQVPVNLGATTDEFGLIYGDFTELLMGIWSEIDILVNPYESTAYAKGNVSIRAMATVDIALRHPASFVKATGVKAAAKAFQ